MRLHYAEHAAREDLNNDTASTDVPLVWVPDEHQVSLPWGRKDDPPTSEEHGQVQWVPGADDLLALREGR